MQAASMKQDQSATRSVGIRELKAKASEIVREVQASGQPIDITVRGRVVARITAPPESPDSTARKREAMRAWLEEGEKLSEELRRVWPSGVSAQDVIDDIRGPW